MKLFLLILTFILLIAQSYGKQVSFEQAKQVAEQFLIQGTNPQLKSSSIFELNDAGSLFNEPSGNTQLKSAHISNRDIYAFNIGNNRGFILISGNNAAVPVLGYSKYGNISPENIPSNMLFWLKEYKNQICYLAEQNTKPSSEAIELWKGLISTEKLLTTTVDPLLTSKWDQSPYENLYSPYDEDYDEVVPTGCGATAMAQIMNYWEFPYAGIGTHTYEDTNYGEQFADFNSMVYDWDNMPDQLDAPNEAVSVLMYHCGVAVDMQYDVSGNGGSGCYTIDDGSGDACVETAFPTYFGYDEGIDGILRNEYSDKDWEDVIIQELEAGRPVQYSGSDIDYGGGHTWACDGYDASSYFHMNWGWGGYCDGFYLLDALVPGTGGIGSGNGDYSYEQDAIIGIQPGILPDLLVENVEWLVDGGDALEYKFDVSNIGEGDVNQDIKCFVLLANDDEEYLLDEFVLTDFLENGTTFSSGTLSVNLSAVLEGNYYLYVVVDAYEEIIETDKENNLDKDEWPVIVEPMLLPDLIVENVNWWSAEDGELTYSFDLSNIGAGDINRDITCYVELYSAEDESDDYELAGEYLIVTNSLAAGETVSTDILTADISSIPSGSYYLAIYVDDLDFLAESNEDNNNGEDSVPLTIENLPDLTVDEVYWYEGYTTEEIQFDFKVTNNGAKDINEDIECVTYLSDGLEEYAIHYYTIEGGLGAGESIETSILTGDLNGIPNGEYSFIVWVNYDSWIEESNEENNI
ncbi:MAG: C10 family peptidase [Prolixibacteraceae bacterium]|jgi:hypothetical protein|nr:C10 family peptidase [Prolixibacteraceae bacterium]